MDKKRIATLILMILGIVVFGETTEAAQLDLPVNTITGSVYQDINENGVMELKNFEITVPKQQVRLYHSLVDAQQDQNVVSTTNTNAVGMFSFSKLKRGNYYIRYDFDKAYRPVNFAQSALDDAGIQTSGIAKIDATNRSKLLYTIDLPQKRVTNLEILPFEDKNWNGLMDSEEAIMDGKTMIILNVRRFSEVIKNKELDGLDVSKLLSGALGGNLDISDAIYFRTTKNGQLINMPDVTSDLYIIIRSPFDLTLTSMVGNITKINALLAIIQGGDIEAILNDPELIAAGDIDTNSDNEYIHLLASILPKIADEVDKINYNEIIGEDNAAVITKTTNQLRAIETLLNKIPAMRFVKVDHFGNSYDLTGLKFKRTNQFFFGIKKYATLSGYTFNDKNKNGKKDLLERLQSIDLTIYDAKGNVLGTVKTPASIGEYKLINLPYDQTLYLGIPENLTSTTAMTIDKPAALADKNIIGEYYIEGTSGNASLRQDIGIIN